MSISFLLKCLVFAIVCIVAVQDLAAQTEDDLLGQLRADYAAILNARAEFEQAVENGNINNAEKADYSAWLQQLDDQFTQSCRTLSASSARLIPADIPCTEFTAAYFAPLSIDIEHETTDGEKTATMVDQFNQSLGEFDEKLLTEQDRVKSQKPRIESSSAGADGGGAGGGESEGGNGQSGENNADEGGQEQAQGNEVASGTEQTAGSAPGSGSAGNRSNTPDDIPDGSDDDVIARQLREAAEKETDPELQKKLWEEYRRYKSGK